MNVLIVQTQRISGGLRNHMAQAIRLVQDGIVGRTGKSAPTVFINSMARNGQVIAEPSPLQ